MESPGGPDGRAPLDRKARKAGARRHVGRKIRLRLRIYALVFSVLLVIVVVELFMAPQTAVLPAAVSLAGGIVVGLVASRMFRLQWDSAAKNVVGKLDVLGVVILVAYIAFSIFRTRLVGLWVPADIVGVCSLAVVDGLMLGQVAGTVGGLKELYKRLALQSHL
ncbi:hypothetical protein [Arthrobacter sp. B2a2-09]|uniref:hypothetical protein n=1 Tax=Arthrobacter sp. B2a2-09 TaxID=2952822 RepID=UPI0022CD42A6|nr:hypothetical protein [Arthrobacter sp. B2a2-09]MCZ9881971.1 hypothetical protein [Arthrobacter sp. B2a2-09]